MSWFSKLVGSIFGKAKTPPAPVIAPPVAAPAEAAAITAAPTAATTQSALNTSLLPFVKKKSTRLASAAASVLGSNSNLGAS